MAAGTGEIVLNEPIRSVGDLLEQLVQRFGPEIQRQLFDTNMKEPNSSLVVLVDGHSIRLLHGLNTPLAEGNTVTIDRIDVMELVGGG